MLVIIVMRNDKEMILKMFPVGSVVELISMDDVQAPPSGTRGKIYNVDDIGQIHVKWDNGSSLALIYSVDKFKLIADD